MLVMSCNVAGGLRKLWPSSLEVLKKNVPDLIGFQELYGEQKAFYLDGMPEYDAFCTIDRPENGMPADGIFYRRDKFNVMPSGANWLSETPHICGIRSWGSQCVRLVNWMILEEKLSGKPFKIYNTHLDHVGQIARERQAEMINKASAVHPKELPQILTGDMNAAISNAVIHSFIANGWRDTYFEANGEDCQGISWHGLDGDACIRKQDVEGNEKGIGRIDWIFVRGPVISRDTRIVKDTDSNGNLPSDHYFVSADVRLD